MNIDLFSTFQYLSSPVFYVVSLLSLYFRHFWQVDNWWIRRDSINTSFYIIPIRHFEVIYLVQAMKSFLAKEDINAVRSFKLPNLVIAMATPLIFHFILKWSKIWHAGSSLLRKFVRLLIYLTKSLSNDSKLSQEESKQFIRGNYQKCQNFHEHLLLNKLTRFLTKSLSIISRQHKKNI